jgi:hypothetical protein
MQGGTHLFAVCALGLPQNIKCGGGQGSHTCAGNCQACRRPADEFAASV